MPPTCNIDARGRRIRLVMAMILSGLALTAGAAAWRWSSVGALAAAIVLGLCAIVGFLEVRYSYCVMKGAGFRVPF